MAEKQAPPAPVAPPAPDISSLYGDSGGLVAAPTPSQTITPPAPDQVHHVEALDAESPALQHFKKQVQGGVEFGKSILFPEGKTETERIKNIGKTTLEKPEEEHTVKAGQALLRADEESKTGHPVKAALSRAEAGAEALLGGTPLVGPLAASLTEQVASEVGSGQYSAAIGDVAGVAATLKAGEDVDAGATKGAEKVVKTAGETAKSALTAAGEDAGKVLNAKAPVGSKDAGKIDLSSVRGTEIKASQPEVEVSHTGHANSINEVKLKQNGEDIAALHFTHDGDIASVNDTWVDESARRQGNGQRLLRESAAKAKANGAKEFTSDPNGETSPAAQQAWDALVRKGEAEETGYDEGKPKYRINLTTAPKPVDLSSVDGTQIAPSDTSFNFGENEKSANADTEGSQRMATNPIAESAQKFNNAKGQPEINHEAPPVNEERGKALAAEMDKHVHEPNNPEVKKSYDSLIKDVKEQWDHAQKDLGIKFEPSEKDPYDSYEAVKNDVEQNKHLKIFTGGNTLPADHPLAQIDPKTGLSYNTMFRGVHDLYGHLAGNNDFSEAGEAGATNSHRQMMSPDSVPALLNESEGQVSQFFHGKDKGNFPPQNATIVPDKFVNGSGVEPNIEPMLKEIGAHPEQHQAWNEAAGQTAAKDEAGGIDPRTGKTDTTGTGSEIMPELRQPLDHAPTAQDFKDFYDKNKAIFEKYPDLRIGWDNTSKAEGGHEINISAVGPDAAKLAKKLDQTSAWDIGKKEVIPTGGEGARTDFPNYPIEERIKDLRGEPQSDIKGYEYLSPDVHAHLEPDERAYLEGNKTLQKNVMAQYHKLAPSIPETTNAMQAGAALGGWWQRYIDVFHNLTDGGQAAAETMGPSHAEILKQWHAALSGNKSVQDANNLAWHSYADWLDAGKPTDRKSIDNIIRKNAAQPPDSGKKGNAAISDTLDKKGNIKSKGLDTSKLYTLVNSPEMKGEKPFGNDVFSDDTAKNPLMGSTEGARKIPSMGATVAGKGNLNRLVIDAHIRDFYGRTNSGGPAAQYIADSAHLRKAAEALGLKGGEGQEQLWGTVLGLKTLLKEGLTPSEAASKLTGDVIHKIGKDYAEVIANDPEISQPGGLLDRIKEKYGIGRGAAGVSEAHSAARRSGASKSQPGVSEAPVNQALSTETAKRILGQISETKIKKPGAAPEPAPAPKQTALPAPEENKWTAALREGDAAAKAKRDAAMKKGISGLK
jgi:predicted GNAT family acetyltransferase